VDYIKAEHVEAYLDQLAKYEPIYTFHNAPFDINVLGFDRFVEALTNNRVWDTGIQFHLWTVEKRGMLEDVAYPDLSQLSSLLLNEKVDKSSGVRTSFNEDTLMDYAHIVYACKDAVVTYLISKGYGHKPTIGTQLRGFMTLDYISRNGLKVNRERMDKRRAEQLTKMEDSKKLLLTWGLIMDKPKDNKYLKGELSKSGIMTEEQANKLKIKPGIVLWSITHQLTQADIPLTDKLANLKQWVTSLEALKPKELQQEYHRAALHLQAILDFKDVPLTKDQVPKYTSTQMYNVLCKQLVSMMQDVDPAEADKALRYDADVFCYWVKKDIPKQTERLNQLFAEAEHRLNYAFPRTKSSTKDNVKYATNADALRMIPDDIIDSIPFLAEYKAYKHAEKLVSTYLDPKFIKADGRVHTRFNPLMATGRTSSRGPNIQNQPKEPGIREIYEAEEGKVLLACDYNQQEMVSLAQHCYTRFGYSRLREVLNAGIDAHDYFAGNMLKLFDDLPEIDPNDKVIVDMYHKALADFIKKDPARFDTVRSGSKPANFGYPGGLGAETFVPYAKGYGVILTVQEAKDLRDMWFKTYPEMEKQLKPTPCTDEGFEDYYCQVILTGRIRNRCGFCAACNTAFQGLSADISKEAGWSLMLAGYNLVNFIHDEYIAEEDYNAYTSLKARRMQYIMEKVMEQFTPDVKVGTEVAAMYQWHKKAKPLFDDKGDILPWMTEEEKQARPLTVA
jgi:hypothetical protein